MSKENIGLPPLEMIFVSLAKEPDAGAMARATAAAIRLMGSRREFWICITEPISKNQTMNAGSRRVPCVLSLSEKILLHSGLARLERVAPPGISD